MKIIKFSALFSTLLLLTSAFTAAPTMATANTDADVSEVLLECSFENETVGQAPKNWSATESAVCTVATSARHNGEKGILLENTSNLEQATISFNITQPLTDEYPKIVFSAWFDLKELDDSGYGLRFSVKDNKNNKIVHSGYFTDVTAGWRKGFVATSEYKEYVLKDGTLTLYITLDGIGKVYIDTLSCGISRGKVVNGDFEAVFSEENPGDNDRLWKYNAAGGWEGNREYITLAKEDNGNTFVKLMKTPSSSYFTHRFYNLEHNRMYKIRYRTYINNTNSNNANCVIFNGGTAVGATSVGAFDALGRVWSPICNTGWTWHEVYFVNQNNIYQGANSFTDISFAGNVGSETGEAWFDDISITPVEEALHVTQNGSEATFVSPGEVEVTYVYPETNFASPSQKTLIVGLYRRENGAKVLESFTVLTGASQGKVANGSGNGTNTQTGYLPLKLVDTITVPGNGGAYTVECFAWDRMGLLRPSIQKLSIE